MKMSSVIFREYDIRGVYNNQFDDGFAEILGKAFVSYIYKKTKNKNPTITLGHDARLSSPALINALSAGITASGGNVLRLGLVTTPMTYFSTFTVSNVDGAIMVTGSHNPPDYNGFKISLGKHTIFGEEIQTLYKIIQDKDFLSGQGSDQKHDIFESYLARYKDEFKNLKNIPCTIDCGNGAAGIIIRKMYESVGLSPTILFEKPDGTFPNHHPDPTVEENLVALKESVLSNKSVVGIGFDGDADRIGVLDETGKMLYGDELIALWSKFILMKEPQQKIIGDVKCSDRVFDYVKKYNGVPIMWKSGHSLVKEKIKIEKAPFGGEMSGHIFFADRNYGYDDAPYAGLRLIEILSQSGKKISELLADLPTAYNTPEIRIDTTEEKKHQAVNLLKEAYKKDTDDFKVNLIDGIRISFKNGWALARASNTQPVLVLRFEADTQSNLEKIRNQVEKIILPILN